MEGSFLAIHNFRLAHLFVTLLLSVPTLGTATSTAKAQSAPVNVPAWYLRAQQTYGVSWQMLMAIDAYSSSSLKGVQEGTRGFHFTTPMWQGLTNPIKDDTSAVRIQFFHGFGKDGDRDGKAVQDDPYDRTAGIAAWLSSHGKNTFEQSEALWEYYENETAVDRILALANVYQKFNSAKLTDRAFPLAKRFSFAYNDTWGQGRSFGGRRMHEGTDLFASYGTPVLSVCYGYVELIGWNRLGGWRIGIRSADNYYYYYAHLSAYAKGVRQGTIVQPGQVIGYVGSSGYGPPGTSGKFPPHLHFGVYRDTGTREWAFDPYPLLKRWERKPQVIIYPKRPVK